MDFRAEELIQYYDNDHNIFVIILVFHMIKNTYLKKTLTKGYIMIINVGDTIKASLGRSGEIINIGIS